MPFCAVARMATPWVGPVLPLTTSVAGVLSAPSIALLELATLIVRVLSTRVVTVPLTSLKLTQGPTPAGDGDGDGPGLGAGAGNGAAVDEPLLPPPQADIKAAATSGPQIAIRENIRSSTLFIYAPPQQRA